MADKLLPCPFCGGDAELWPMGINSEVFEVKCLKCGAHTLSYDMDTFKTRGMDDAVRMWNTRAVDTDAR